MNDESHLQVRPKDTNSTVRLAKARSGLIARGRRDAETLILREPTDRLSKIRQRAEEGDANAQLELGEAYDSGSGVARDFTEAVRWYRKAAEQGYAEAQCILGVCFLGSDEPPEQIEAAGWFRNAAEQGHADAQFWLGRHYRDGEGVSQDQVEAVRWFRRSADQGHGDAQFELGVSYRDGEGLPQDYVLAHMWFTLSASNRSARIHQERLAEARDDVTSKMTPSQIAEARLLARKWKEKKAP